MNEEINYQRYYAIALKLKSKYHFMIYAMGETDYIVSENNEYLHFHKMDELKLYAMSYIPEKIQNEECVVYDFDYLENFILDPENLPIKFSEIMNCWIYFDDLCNEKFRSGVKYSHRSNELSHLYQKLLFEVDVFDKGDRRSQDWSMSDLLELKSLMELGLTHFKDVVKMDGHIN